MIEFEESQITVNEGDAVGLEICAGNTGRPPLFDVSVTFETTDKTAMGEFQLWYPPILNRIDSCLLL